MIEKAKINIRALRTIVPMLKDVYESYKHNTDILGKELILTGLPLPFGCAHYRDVKPDEMYRVSYTGYIQKNHYRAMKKLYNKGKTIEEKKELIQEYIEKYRKPDTVES